MNLIDQLFKGKLEGHRVTPRSESWAKVEASLSKKNDFGVAWRIAAGLVFFGLALGTGLYWRGNRQELATTPIEKDELIQSKTESMPLATAEDNQVPTADKKTPVIRKKSKIDPLVAPILVVENKKTDVEEITITEPLVVTPEMVVAKVEKPIVIEFTLEPLPAAPAVADQKSNTFRKVLDKALDIKNGEGDFGSLREAKNELFALDFRKEKTKRN